MGGDEFIILISHKVYPNLHNIIDRIKAEFARPWRLKGTEYYCTMSMGVVRFPTDGDTVEELIKKADIAMYDAKCAGKNRVAYYDENVISTSFKRLIWRKICAMRPEMRLMNLKFIISQSRIFQNRECHAPVQKH